MTVADSGAPRLMTLLFSDIEGSTRLLRRAADGYHELLHRHREIVRDEIARTGGHEQGTEGDSFFVVFDGPAAACVMALAVQQRLAAEEWPEDCRIRVRMGLHTGEVAFHDGWIGMAVHEAARIGAVAHGGQVVVSDALRAVVADTLPEGASFADLGRHRLKDFDAPVRLYQLNQVGLDDDFPPVRSLADLRLANNLPGDVSSFIGRERELETLRQLVRASRLVTVTGAGGSGKTRLAVELGREQLDGTGDGVWLVELAPISDPKAVATAVANAVGVREDPARPTLETLVEALDDRSMLLILDNCEHVVDEVAIVADRFLRSCPGITLLATSREALQIDGEQVYRVPSMPVPASDESDVDGIAASEAVRLFVERAGRHRPGFAVDAANAVAVASVCRRLDGIPLAIELAAARLRSLSIADIDTRLDDRFGLLTGGSRVAMPRQQTLRALIDWSWELLTPVEQDVLTRFSVFAGGFDLAGAAAVGATGAQAPPVVASLEALVDKSLVQAADAGGTMRYLLLETVRQYAADRLAAEPAAVEAARRGHWQHYLALAEEAAPHLVATGQGEWLNRLDLERDNLTTAMAQSLAHGEPVVSLRLATALRYFWKTRGYAAEGVAAIGEALARSADAAPAALRGASLVAMGHLLEQVGGYREASERTAEASAIAAHLGDRWLAADAFHTRSYVTVHLGDASAALAMADEGLALALAVGDDRLVAALRAARSVALDVAGDHEGAITESLESVACYRRVGDQIQVGTMLGNLGYSELSLGRLEDARSHLAESLGLARELHDPYGVIYETGNLGIAAYLEGDAEEAADLFTESLMASRRHAVRAGFAYALIGVGLVRTLAGRHRDAAMLHGASAAIFDQLEEVVEPLEGGLCERDLVTLRTALGDDAFASAHEEGRNLPLDALVALALG